MTTETLPTLNVLAPDDFVREAGFLVENSPWLLRPVAEARPFADVAALCDEIERALHKLSRDQQIVLMNSHPELAGAEATTGAMNADSTSEQARLGLLALDRSTLDRLTALNKAYRTKFGFPCIIALWVQPDLDAVMRLFETRLKNDAQTELDRNLTQIGLVVRSRAERIDPVAFRARHDANQEKTQQGETQ